MVVETMLGLSFSMAKQVKVSTIFFLTYSVCGNTLSKGLNYRIYWSLSTAGINGFLILRCPLRGAFSTNSLQAPGVDLMVK